MMGVRAEIFLNGKQAHQIARLVSSILHPWIVLAIIMGLAAYTAASHNGEWIKWTILALLLSYLPAAIYAGIRTLSLRRTEDNDNAKLSLLRERPRELLITASLFGFPAVLTLYILSAPLNIIVVVMAAAATMLAVALVNLKYRASFHIALLTSAIFSLWALVGVVAIATISLVPLLGLSRYRLGEHNAGQLVIGFALGFVITMTVFYGFGLVSG